MLLRPVPVYAALIFIGAACFSGIWIGHRDGPVAQQVPPVKARIFAPEAPRSPGDSPGISPGGSSRVSPGPSPGLANRQDTTGAWGAGGLSRREGRNGGFQITPRDAVSLAGALGSDTL